ncbi:MAG: thiol:disulfide interchange protein DsbA/DsbL, partial [Gammaproteobacteria bacterium]
MRTWLWFIIGWLALFPAPGSAEKSFDEGIEYELVTPPQPTEDPSKIEVLEFFWYGCPHCYHAEPLVEAWLKRKPEDVVFRRMPAIFTNPLWELHARAYYTAEALGIVDKIHRPLFDAIHKERRPMNTEKDIEAFFAEHGV